jgi:cyclic pyranopterin monophosphate synthase
MAGKLSHINERGEAHMVDVGEKALTQRFAVAEGTILMAPETLGLIERGEAKKGDVIATARIAGIMAAKRCHELIPMCHPLLITKAAVDFEILPDRSGIRVRAEVRVSGQTGVEMEALTAATVSCLTLYDMLKAVDRSMTITDVRLLEKAGGKSGHFVADGIAPGHGSGAEGK